MAAYDFCVCSLKKRQVKTSPLTKQFQIGLEKEFQGKWHFRGRCFEIFNSASEECGVEKCKNRTEVLGMSLWKLYGRGVCAKGTTIIQSFLRMTAENELAKPCESLLKFLSEKIKSPDWITRYLIIGGKDKITKIQLLVVKIKLLKIQLKI